MQNPFMLIVGEEEKNGTISIRRHGQEGKGNISVTIEEFAENSGRRDQRH
jgi:threonyl-tRNA synthetase